MYERILVPVDLTHTEKLSKALSLAAQMAKAHDATVVYAGVADAVPTSSKVSEKDRMQADLDTFAAEQAKEHGIKTADHVTLRRDLHLNVGSELIQSAKDTNCDLIVMASHVPGFLDHILWSNAGYVATHAPMSVYVVR